VIPIASSEAQPARNAASPAKPEMRGPLAQLLHALNQPLTGLQCSMEVALASPRTNEQYIQGLREGLELTGRMRALVEAIREVADGEEQKSEEPETDFKTVLREVLDELWSVAEVNGVRIALDCSSNFSVLVRAGERRLSSLVFRTLESALSLAERGSALRIEIGSGSDAAADGVWIRVCWHAGSRLAEFSRPELGLLVARAGWERVNAKWERERTGNLETVTVGLPSISASNGNS
jgi:signal transduction histidine kinase